MNIFNTIRFGHSTAGKGYSYTAMQKLKLPDSSIIGLIPIIVLAISPYKPGGGTLITLFPLHSHNLQYLFLMKILYRPIKCTQQHYTILWLTSATMWLGVVRSLEGCQHFGNELERGELAAHGSVKTWVLQTESRVS